MSTSIPEIYQAEKCLALPVAWSRANEFNDEFVVPLTIDGVVIQGLRLRGRATRLEVDRDIMLQIEYNPAGRRIGALARLQWRPFSAHGNQGQGPPEYRWKQLTGSHHHSFALNWYQQEGRMLAGSLPVAVPIDPDPASVKEFFQLAENEFRIMVLGASSMPFEQADLLRG